MPGPMTLPSVERFLYFLYSPSSNIQSYYSFANFSLPTPYASVTALRTFAPGFDMMRYLRSLLVSSLGYFLIGFGYDFADSRSVSASGPIYRTRFPNVTWNNDLWQVRTASLDQGHYQSRMSVCNGFLGINVAALGPFFEADTPVNGDNINGWVRDCRWANRDGCADAWVLSLCSVSVRRSRP